LRRRWYDVEANYYNEEYNGGLDRVYDYFEDVEYIGVYGNGETFVHNEDFIRRLCSDELVDDDAYTYKKDISFCVDKQTYTAASIEKAILANNPPGSRGFIDVVWDLGGGHSIVYEVTEQGKVVIRDSQIYDEYGLEELAYRASTIRIARTDNLELKEEILSAVKPNEDGRRKYYVDKRKLRMY
jgi:hypothetical protein